MTAILSAIGEAANAVDEGAAENSEVLPTVAVVAMAADSVCKSAK